MNHLRITYRLQHNNPHPERVLRPSTGRSIEQSSSPPQGEENGRRGRKRRREDSGVMKESEKRDFAK
jgi:hypothetical protein